MNIYNFMSQKYHAASRGEKTNIKFEYLKLDMKSIMKKVYLN